MGKTHDFTAYQSNFKLTSETASKKSMLCIIGRINRKNKTKFKCKAIIERYTVANPWHWYNRRQRRTGFTLAWKPNL